MKILRNWFEVLRKFPAREFAAVLLLSIVVYGLISFATFLVTAFVNPSSFQDPYAKKVCEFFCTTFATSVQFSSAVGCLIGFLFMWKQRMIFNVSYKAFMLPFFIVFGSSMLVTVGLAVSAVAYCARIVSSPAVTIGPQEHVFMLTKELFGSVAHFVFIFFVFATAKQIELHLAAKDYRFRWIYEPNSMYDLTPYMRSRPSDDGKEP